MRGRVIVALALVAIGLVWIAQGLDLLGGSGFMDGDVRWALIGAALVIAGIAIVVNDRRNRPPA
jgi:hypothetical protein